MAKDLRTTRASMQLAAGVSGVTELPLPMIEGQLLIPLSVHFLLALNEISQDIVCGLSHNRAFTAVATAQSWFEEPSVWIAHSFGSDNDFHEKLDSDTRPIAGPQRLFFFNGGAQTHDLLCRLTYTTRQIGLIEWANNATITSFEA